MTHGDGSGRLYGFKKHLTSFSLTVQLFGGKNKPTGRFDNSEWTSNAATQ
jgi:hypothetical protein